MARKASSRGVLVGASLVVAALLAKVFLLQHPPGMPAPRLAVAPETARVLASAPVAPTSQAASVPARALRRTLQVPTLAPVAPPAALPVTIVAPPEPDRDTACQLIEQDAGALRRATGWSQKTLGKLQVMTRKSAQQLCMLPEAERAALRKAAKAELKADAIGMLAYFDSLHRDSSGTVPPEGIGRALEARRAMGRAPTAHSATGNARESARAGIAPRSWTQLGPLNTFSGRVDALHIDPRDANIILVGTNGGGLWRSTDGGEAWQAVGAVFSASHLVADPARPDTLYATASKTAMTSGGLWRSLDNGLSWNVALSIGQIVPGRAGSADAGVYAVNDIAISPADPRLIVVSIDQGALRSADAGASWEQVVPAYNSPYTRFVSFDPKDGRKVFVGTNKGVLIVGSGLGTAAETWQEQPLGAAAADTATTKMAWSSDGSRAWIASSDEEGSVYRSTDGGSSFSLLSTPRYCGNQCGYNDALWVDPSNAQRIVLGGVPLLRSNDGGVNWEVISNGPDGSSVHVDHHVLLAAPGFDGGANRTLFSGNDGGLFRTNDISAPLKPGSGVAGLHWDNVGKGIDATQFYALDGNAKAGVILGGTQDNGTFRHVSGTVWERFSGGDGGYPAIPAAGSPLYSSMQNFQIMRKTDGQLLDIGPDTREKSMFIAPVLLDPNQDRRMYSGAQSLWVTDDATADGVYLAQPIWRTVKGPSASNQIIVSAIAVAPGDSNRVWVAHTDGSVYRTDDALAAAPAWVEVRPAAGTHRYCTSIFIGDAQARRVTLSYSGYGSKEAPNSVLRTRDGGANWSDISANLPLQSTMSVIERPDHPDYLYVGTDTGVYASENGGLSWSANNDGPAIVPVMMLRFYDDTTLLAATFGRGIWRANLAAAGVPDAPLIGKARAGGGQASVTFTPAGDGGRDVIAYTVTASPGGATASAPASPIMVAGLSNGTAYTFTVTARNAIGTSAPSQPSNSVVPQGVSPTTDRIAAGSAHSLLIKSDASLWAWGGNWAGQLGDGSTRDAASAVLIDTAYRAVAAGTSHTVGLKTDGSLWTWGGNANGQLGDGSTSTRPRPTRIGADFAAIAAGKRHTLALKADGSLWAWGANEFGQLGDGTLLDRHAPVLIGTGFAAISAGDLHSAALKTDLSIWTWGNSGLGQSGDGSRAERRAVLPIEGSYATLAAGQYSTFAIDPEGTLWSWGSNQGGVLGLGGGNIIASPAPVAGGFSTVAAGDYHTLAIKTDGSLWGWGGGTNNRGQLGDGSLVRRDSPVLVGTDFVAVSAGASHSVGIKSDGSVWTWGGNERGQLGDATQIDRNAPVQVASALVDAAGAPRSLSAVAGNREATLRFVAPLNSSGAITGYAANCGSQTASATASPITVTGLANGSATTCTVTAMSTAGAGPASHSVAVTPRTVPGAPVISFVVAGKGQASVAFTAPDNGGAAIAAYTVSATPGNVSVSGNSSPITITGLSNGVAYVFTVSASNVAGTGAPSRASASVTPIGLAGAPTIRDASSGNASASIAFGAPTDAGGGIITSYTARCGSHTASATTSPITVTGLANGSIYTCTVSASNAAGLGPASTTVRVAPRTVPDAPAIGRAFAGNGQASVVFTAPDNGGAAIDAYTVNATPGNLSVSGGTSPIRIKGLVNGVTYTFTVAASNAAGTGAKSAPSNGVTPMQPRSSSHLIAAGAWHALAIKSDASLWAWGDNTSGQLGDASGIASNSPVMVGDDYVTVAAGDAYSLGIKADGTLWAWGSNSVGQLGDGSTTKRLAPVLIGTDFAAVAAGAAHSLAVKTDGTLWAWGDGRNGRLGDGTVIERHIPTQVGSGFASVAAGQAHSLALKTDGSLWAWGANFAGQLGDGSVDDRHSPVRVGSDYTVAAAGTYHTVALRTNGTLWAWGFNYNGQLGGGDGGVHPIPAQLPSVFAAVAAGAYHTVALKADGTVWAWGGGSGQPPNGTNAGQVGDGSTVQHDVPVQIGTGFRELAAGQRFSIGLLDNGSVFTWGDNSHGQLGDGTALARWSPIEMFKLGMQVPGQPLVKVIVPGDASASIAFSAPVSTGGVITAYTARCASQTASADASPIVVTGLANGGTYQCTVSASNSAGSGPASNATSVTLFDLAQAPAMLGSSPGDASASIAFSAPANASGSGVTRYTASCGGQTASGSASPIVVSGLVNGQTYDCFVVATGALGPSPKSATMSLTPRTVPSAPTVGAAIAGQRQATLAFTAPSENGGAPVTQYTVTASPGGKTASGSASPITVTGLEKDIAYTFTVAASNGAGTGPASLASNSVTPHIFDLVLAEGWNLVGNSVDVDIPVASLFGDARQVRTVWKWVAARSKWAVYTPSVAEQAMPDYAASLGHEVLATINGGDGFWVNASTPFEVALPAGNVLTSASLNDAVDGTSRLARGWSLIAVGDNPSPRALNTMLEPSPQSAGTDRFNSLWSWDHASGSWYFYAPRLDASGELAGFLASKGYRDFSAPPAKTLTPTSGFWINR